VNPAVKYGTAIVLAHLLVNIVHGAAHRELHVELRPAAMLFVIGVILLCPLIAMVLLWVSQEPLGLALLALSMAASLIFGLTSILQLWAQELNKKLCQAQRILRQQPFPALAVDCRITTIPGADFCFGIGTDLKEAEVSLKHQEELRKASR
jgi:hypothetical protein